MRATSLPLLAICLGALFSAWAQQGSAPRTLRYSIYTTGQKAGAEVDTFSAGGKLTCTFEFNDRGRGPKIEARYVIGHDGKATLTDITGVDYYMAPVDVPFSNNGGQVDWQSADEE